MWKRDAMQEFTRQPSWHRALMILPHLPRLGEFNSYPSHLGTGKEELITPSEWLAQKDMCFNVVIQEDGHAVQYSMPQGINIPSS